MTPEAEHALVERILRGDRNAFAAIVEENQKNVYRLALRITGSEEDALDMSQEVFLRAYTELGRFRGECRLSVWLYRMTYNACIDLQRRKKRRPTVPLVQPGGESGEDLEFPDLRYAPETETERRELREAVRQAVDTLSPEHRQVLLMREFGDMSYADMAAALGVSEGTVKSRLARARERAAGILLRNGTFPASGRQKSGKEGRRDG